MTSVWTAGEYRVEVITVDGRERFRVTRENNVFVGETSSLEGLARLVPGELTERND